MFSRLKNLYGDASWRAKDKMIKLEAKQIPVVDKITNKTVRQTKNHGKVRQYQLTKTTKKSNRK